MNNARPHKKRIEAMRDSMAIAVVLLRSYDAVIDDLPNHGIRHDAVTCVALRERRNQLDADIRRLRDDMEALAARSIATHNEPVHVDSTKTTTVRVYVKCGASEARVEVRARRRA